MTPDEFRADGKRRAALASALRLPAVKEALLALKEEHETQVLPLGLSPIDLVRAAAEQHAKAVFVKRLHDLTTPLPKREPEQLETFGSGHSVEEFDNPITKTK